MVSNQLKLNANSVIDGLNLVNVIQKPQPIVIHNLAGHAHHRNHSPPTRDFYHEQVQFTRPSDFEIVDEDKMRMYSFLVRREMKTKEWLSRFGLNHPDQVPGGHDGVQQQADQMNQRSKGFVRRISAAKTNRVDTATTRNSSRRQSPNGARMNRFLGSPRKPPNELDELRNCCDETIRAVEYLESKLIEYKFERLKVVLNDPVEEEKQLRIQMGQLKFLSRSIYNSQIQLGKLKRQQNLTRSKSPSWQRQQQQNQKNIADPSSHTSSTTTTMMTPVTRLCHTMRSVNKSIQAFADLYPYRPDDNIRSERLCFHFFKQAHLCVHMFGEYLLGPLKFLPDSKSHETTANKLTDLMDNCSQYFDDFAAHQASGAHEMGAARQAARTIDQSRASKLDDSARVLNVVRVPRSRRNVNHTSLVPPQALSTHTVISAQNSFPSMSTVSRVEISPARKVKQQIYKKKKIKTATLYPSRLATTKVMTIVTAAQKPAKESKNQLNPKSAQTRKQQQQPERVVAVSKSSSRESSIEHISTPVLDRKISIVRRSRSADDYSTPTRQQPVANHMIDGRRAQTPSPVVSVLSEGRAARSPLKKTRPVISGTRNLAEFENGDYWNETTSLGRNRSILRRSSPKQLTVKARQALTRIDMIKRENDAIRNKYESLAYNEHLVEKFVEQNNGGRRYEELYATLGNKLDHENEDEVEKPFYRTLRRPTIKQLKRVVTYAERFGDYADRTSITKIGSTRFDDFELFEHLAGDIFDSCFTQVLDEIESINAEMTSNLVKGEMISASHPHRETTLMFDLSPRRSGNRMNDERSSTAASRTNSFLTSSPTRSVTHGRRLGPFVEEDERSTAGAATAGAISARSYNDDSFISIAP